jgi:hypothetical protein
MPTGPRPFGVGPYGAGPYSTWAHLYLMGGASGITFDAKTQGMPTTFNPAAITQIVFSVTAAFELTWPGWAPCETGTWPPAGPCEDGTWTAPPPCRAGNWDETRLEELVP